MKFVRKVVSCIEISTHDSGALPAARSSTPRHRPPPAPRLLRPRSTVFSNTINCKKPGLNAFGTHIFQTSSCEAVFSEKPTSPHCCYARRVDCARASGSHAAADLAGRSPRHRAVGSLTACHVFCRSSSVTACFEGWTSADHSHLSSFLRARAVEERCTIMCLRNVTKVPALGGENHLPVERQCRRSRATTGPR